MLCEGRKRVICPSPGSVGGRTSFSLERQMAHLSKFYKGIGWEKVLAGEISGKTVFRGAKLYLNPMGRITDGIVYNGFRPTAPVLGSFRDGMIYRGEDPISEPVGEYADGYVYLGVNVDGQEPVGEADDLAGAAALLLFGFVKMQR